MGLQTPRRRLTFGANDLAAPAIALLREGDLVGQADMSSAGSVRPPQGRTDQVGHPTSDIEAGKPNRQRDLPVGANPRHDRGLLAIATVDLPQTVPTPSRVSLANPSLRPDDQAPPHPSPS
jgi:hypothetical protein